MDKSELANTVFARAEEFKDIVEKGKRTRAEILRQQSLVKRAETLCQLIGVNEKRSFTDHTYSNELTFDIGDGEIFDKVSVYMKFRHDPESTDMPPSLCPGDHRATKQLDIIFNADNKQACHREQIKYTGTFNVVDNQRHLSRSDEGLGTIDILDASDLDDIESSLDLIEEELKTQ